VRQKGATEITLFKAYSMEVVKRRVSFFVQMQQERANPRRLLQLFWDL
jgi:hypothetical protein